MLFRDTDTPHSSVSTEENSSSGGSLASSESYATRAFENRMKLLLEGSPILDMDFQENDAPLNTFMLPRDSINNEKMSETGLDHDVEKGEGEGEGMVSCFNCDDEVDWSSLMHRLDGVVNLDTQFHEYPSPDYFKTCPIQQSNVEDHGSEGGGSTSSQQQQQQPHHPHHGTKMFIGGLRFEVVQVGRHMISWIFEVACGVRLPPTSILVHRKAKGGKSGSPTGCASVFVASEHDVEKLLRMNQRIFCGEKGVHVAPTAEHMAQLISSKAILDVAEGRARGPTHPVIIERAYGAAGHHRTRSSASGASSRQESLTQLPSGPPPPYDPHTSPALASSAASSLRSNSNISVGVSLGMNTLTGGGNNNNNNNNPPPPPLLTPAEEAPVFHAFPGEAVAAQMVQRNSVELRRPALLFVGGFSPEASREFIAWAFGCLGVAVNPVNIFPYEPEKGGCALVRVEEAEVSRATGWGRRVLCDSTGVYLSSSPRGILALLASRDKSAGTARRLVIKRKDNSRLNAVAGNTANNLLSPPMGPPPPPPFPGAWDQQQQQLTQQQLQQLTQQLTQQQQLQQQLTQQQQLQQLTQQQQLQQQLTQQQQLQQQLTQPRPPPPYMQNVVIGNQTYQVPIGASIQLQLVPVITAPNMTPTPIPIQTGPPPPPMYPSMPPPPPPPMR